jgi:hypothetical protein
MSTQTEQRYVVHLDIPATALDPTSAVQEALQQVLAGKNGSFACRVEEVGSASSGHSDRDPYDSSRRRHQAAYPNEFWG